MNDIASREPIGARDGRWALIAAPVCLLLGFASGRLSNSGYGNPWFDALDKPGFMPPGWAFGAAWSVLYLLLGVAVALVLGARSHSLRRTAIILFVVQFATNLVWSPLFFAAHQVRIAFWLIVLSFVLGAITARAFGRIRPLAGWLFLPYLAWLVIAGALNWEIARLNPGAERLVPSASASQIG